MAERIQSNEDRADIGETIVEAYGHDTGMTVDKEERDTVLSDLIADLAHYCARYGIDPREMFERGLGSYDQDNDPTEIGGYAPVIQRKGD